ncbi:MAG TPA: rhodanese-like domain-containing protein [Acidimicrobiales bacterium]|nr:rhodanese-like domain-containing protein [Acidimicrobiales bacterium]
MSGWGPPPPVVPEVDVDELDRRRVEGVPVIDVRQPDEYDTAHVPGARLIPLGEVAARVGEVPTDGTVYVICQTGARSARATDFLRRQGIDAQNVAGGTKAWIESGRAVARGSNPG